MFRVGQKVVCVDADGIHGLVWAGDAPEVGRVYTVSRYFMRGNRPTVHLVELARSAKSRAQHGKSVGYSAHRFRPAVDKPTDISIFKKMLAPSKRELVS